MILQKVGQGPMASPKFKGMEKLLEAGYLLPQIEGFVNNCKRRRSRASASGEMSVYENVVGGKLKLKGKALDVKAAGMKKKKSQKKKLEGISQSEENENTEVGTYLNKEEADASRASGDGKSSNWDDHLTPAERRYIEQRAKIDSHKLAKTSNKSHRDRIQDFNQYLANMSEHYDIPKVGPG